MARTSCFIQKQKAAQELFNNDTTFVLSAQAVSYREDGRHVCRNQLQKQSLRAMNNVSTNDYFTVHVMAIPSLGAAILLKERQVLRLYYHFKQNHLYLFPSA
jgi:hypothetical protein